MAEHTGTIGGHHRQLVAVDVEALVAGVESLEFLR